MATISKITLSNGGTRYEVRIKQDRKLVNKKRFSTLKAAKAYSLRVEGDKDLLAAMGAGAGTVSFSDLADQYLAQFTGKAHGRTGDVAWWKSQIGNARILSITVQRLNQILDKYEASPVQVFIGKVKGVPQYKAQDRTPTAASVNSKRAAIIAILKHGVSQGLLTDNVANKMRRRSGEVKRQRYLTPDEESRLLAAARQSHWPQMYLLVLAAIDTGARKGELIGLKWADVDLKGRTALLRDTKTGDDRRIPLSLAVVEELLRHRQTTNPYVFPGSIPGKPMDPRKAWERLLVDTGIEGFRFHDLRHSAASFLLSAGHSLDEIGRLLGHKSAQTTIRYAHLLETKGREMVDTHAARRAVN